MQKKPKRRVNAKGRNTGEKFVMLHKWLIESSAYRSLGCPARALLTELYLRYNGSNNGHIFLSYREATERLGVGYSTIARSFDQLEGRGFIVCRKRGSFKQKIVNADAIEQQGSRNRATEWFLTEYLLRDQSDYKAFVKWSR